MAEGPEAGRQALQIEGLTKVFDRRLVVDHISFAVAPDEIIGLVGPNGAGKTTTIDMILGILKPTSGTVRIDGRDVATDRERALMHTNFSAVYAPLPGNLTVAENLRVFGMLYDVDDLSRRIGEVIDVFELGRFRNVRCGLLSSGEQTRVSLAKAVLNRPSLLLLDEPTASIDPSTADTVRKYIRDYVRGYHGAVLWTSHNMYEVEEVCDRVLLLFNGRIVMEGDPRKLPANYGEQSLEKLFIDVAAKQAPTRAGG